ncbi:MAG: hypothetical protein KDC44_19475, partial [Phaeodactylibacter sp.]|nr:hypothetical protein [Phaeodactylibacter sp.]
MKTISFVSVLLCLFSASLLTAQDFKFKKKINKYVFKSQDGELDETKAFDQVDNKFDDIWYVANEGLWGILDGSGNYTLPVIFQQIDHHSDKSSLVKFEGTWGEYREGQFHAIEGGIIFRNPQKPPHL